MRRPAAGTANIRSPLWLPDEEEDVQNNIGNPPTNARVLNDVDYPAKLLSLTPTHRSYERTNDNRAEDDEEPVELDELYPSSVDKIRGGGVGVGSPSQQNSFNDNRRARRMMSNGSSHFFARSPCSSSNGDYDFGPQLRRPQPQQASLTDPNDSMSYISSSFQDLCTDMTSNMNLWCKQAWTKLVSYEKALEAGHSQLREQKRRFQHECDEHEEREENRLRKKRERMDSVMQNMTEQINSEREQSRQRFKAEKLAFDQERERITKSLDNWRLELEQARERFEIERSRVNDLQLAQADVVQFNVGGQIFQTARTTIETQPDSYLARLISGHYQLSPPANRQSDSNHSDEQRQSAAIFLDRDPDMFRKILSFLRKPEWFPQLTDAHESERLALDAEFLGIRFYNNPLICVIGGMRHVLRQECSTRRSGNDAYFSDADYKVANFLNDVEVCEATFGRVHRSSSLDSAGRSSSNNNSSNNTRMPLTAAAARNSNSVWFQMTIGPMSTPRAYMVADQILNSIYVAGGRNQEFMSLCESEAYDLFLQRWRTIQPMNEARRDHCGCTYDNRVLYCIGGFNGNKALGSAEFYDPRTPAWIKCRPMSYARVNAVCVSHRDQLYVFGGAATGGCSGDDAAVTDNYDSGLFCETYDVRANAWRTLPDPVGNAMLGSAAATVLGNNVYIVGGCTNYKLYVNTGQNLIFNIKDHAWSFGSECLDAVRDACLVTVPNSQKLMCIGGSSHTGACMIYDTATDKWFYGPPLETGERLGHSACVVNL